IKSFKFSKGSVINMQKTDEKVSGYLDARNSHFSILQFQFKVLIAFKVLITASMLIIGSLLLVNQQLNIGQFIAAEIVIISIIASVEKLIGNLDSVYDVLTSVDKIAKITDKPVETSGSYILPEKREGLSVEAEKVSFAYDDEKYVLKDASFRIDAGETVCITGKEGSGKSTLLKLVSGSYQGFEGSLLLNRLPVGNYELKSLREQTGILLNQQDIFHGSLLENITMGQPGIDLQQVIRLFGEVGLANFLGTLPQGFDTWLDPTGKRLSRNVVNKILLVRALVGQPRLLLLEEPWTHIEEPFRSRIIRLLLNDYPHTTILVVSADPEFTSRCSKVIDVNCDGCIVKTNKSSNHE
ncbi:MAG TPA: ABC transporter ATP-binding protein, partial [Chitinophagaceae bacterium]|nr:ABC transporter ATP-binding protein [Chitinophagaceae bacterium]